MLSLVDKQGQNIRGYLRLGDLFNLDYPADLIVLSACETGLGKEIQGEGLVGLTRGLMYAGAERLVVSLWQVSDEGTAVFMQEFYKQMLQEGKSANQALRATQLKMWNQEKWRNPNYWAALRFWVSGRRSNFLVVDITKAPPSVVLRRSLNSCIPMQSIGTRLGD